MPGVSAWLALHGESHDKSDDRDRLGIPKGGVGRWGRVLGLQVGNACFVKVQTSVLDTANLVCPTEVEPGGVGGGLGTALWIALLPDATKFHVSDSPMHMCGGCCVPPRHPVAGTSTTGFWCRTWGGSWWTGARVPLEAPFRTERCAGMRCAAVAGERQCAMLLAPVVV